MDANLQKYLAFIKVVETGSFTRAAEALHYSQSGISRMIAELEKEWKVSVLERDRSGVRLTADGIKLLPFVRDVYQSYRRLQEEACALAGLESGLIRIGTVSSIATHLLPPVIKNFRRDYPAIEFELIWGDYGEIEQWVLDGRVDCGFLLLPETTELETIPLYRDELRVLLPEDHPLAEKDVIADEDLNDQPFVLLEKEGKGDRAEISWLLEQRGISPDIAFTAWDDYAIMSMVENGLGVSILSDLIMQRAPYRIVKKSLARPAYRNLGLAMRDQEAASPAMKKFLEYVKPYGEA